MAGGKSQVGCTLGGCFATSVFIIFCVAMTVGFLGFGSDTTENDSTKLSGIYQELEVGGKTIRLPASKGKSAQEEYLSGMTFSSECNEEEERWYINMRWPYTSWAWSTNGDTRDITKSIDVKTSATKPLYARKRVVVYNPRTKKTVVTAICESGPAPWTGSSWAGAHGNKGTPLAPYWPEYFQFDPPEADGRVAGLAPKAFDAIGANMNDKLEYGFAQDQTTPLGPK